MATKRYPESELHARSQGARRTRHAGGTEERRSRPAELESWLVGAVRKEPLTIHDINGTPLFHDWNADYAVGGAVTWEDWDAVTHTNYVYANVDCP